MGVDHVLGGFVEEVAGNDGLDHVFDDVAPDDILGNVGIVLGAHDDGVDALGFAVAVLHGHLGFSVGPKVGDQSLLAHEGEPPDQAVGESDGKGHELRGLVAGETNHHALVSGADHLRHVLAGDPAFFGFSGSVHTQGYVLRLLPQSDGYAAGGGIEAKVCVDVANAADGVADDLRILDVGFAGDLPQDDHKPGGHRGLTSHTGTRDPDSEARPR